MKRDGNGSASRDAPIGIFGGTFDPVHRGHIQVALDASEALELDDFRLVPAGDPPHRDGTHAPVANRVDMLRLALRGYTGLQIDTREVDRPGRSYMVDTLESLREAHPDSPLMLVLGQDAANGLDRWHEWQRLPQLAHLVVMTRPGERPMYGGQLGAVLNHRETSEIDRLKAATSGLLLHLEVSPVDISSTEIRRRIAAGDPVVTLLPPGVLSYIEAHGLYGAGDSA